ncbi:MAG: rhomboid family intramembrane serine protease, partial [Pseudomonadota bacterium]
MTSSCDPREHALLILIGLIALNILIELTLVAADHGLIGSTRWRALAYQNGAFWAGLLHNWRPNYAAQPWVMFLSYSFLHGGLLHLIGNMLVLWGLGRVVMLRLGTGRFLVLYFVSAIGGALCFGLLSNSPQPMVGASGALFGLLGAWQAWRYVLRRRRGQSLWPVWQAVLGLVLLNVVMWVALKGLVAWETHLGGFIAGWICAALIGGRAQPSV